MGVFLNVPWLWRLTRSLARSTGPGPTRRRRHNSQRTSQLRFYENRHSVKLRGPSEGHPTFSSYACRLGHVEVVKVLLRHPRIVVNQQDQDGDTPLMAALRSERTRRPPAPAGSHEYGSLADFQGKTPLDYAFSNNNFKAHVLINAQMAKDALKDVEEGKISYDAYWEEAIRSFLTYIGPFRVPVPLQGIASLDGSEVME